MEPWQLLELQQISFLAGIISTIMFASSNIPMLVKAFRTRNLESYSLLHIAMSNAGNAVHWVYIVGLPWGPIWFLHGFYTVTTALMLAWYLRHRSAETRGEEIDSGARSVP